ncbi:MAG TPA: molybdopterin molybdenumtransferase MoeA [Clostridiales bacterium UBA8960]|jgi:molybdopterin molybdotransferase|nr:molybdopterin molybdenumtransferase MoeA [Clostridiales bacterium UBA8960]
MIKKIELNPIEVVLKLIETSFSSGPSGSERVLLEDALGRVLKYPLISHEMVPAFAKSTVDGYAIKNSDGPFVARLLGNVDMGLETSLVLKEGECVYVPTGGMIPDGSDAMAMIEDTERLEDGTVKFLKGAKGRDNIIEVGSDMSIGSEVLAAGTIIGVHEIGALASLGHYEVEVLKRPTIAIISTGDELVTSSEPLEKGKIRELNTFALSAICKKIGLTVVSKKVLPDQYALIRAHLDEAVNTADLVVISGGSSVGEKDYTQALMEDVCTEGVLLAGMAIKPGKPTIIAKHGDVPVFGLPGHPVSTIVVFNILAARLLKTWGHKVEDPHAVEVRLTKNVYAAKGRDTYQMVKISNRGNEWVATPTSGKSGMITLLTNSNGYVIIPKEAGMFSEGDVVKGVYF